MFSVVIVRRALPTLVCALLATSSSCTYQQMPASVLTPVPGPAAPSSPGGAPASGPDLGSSPSAGGAKSGNLRPYDSVVTRHAKTLKGLFITHRINERLYFELPAPLLGRDMLLVGRFARAAATDPGNGPYGGDQFLEKTLRWERLGNRIFLRSPNFDITVDSSLPISRAVTASNYAPIIAAFEVATYGPDSAAVIDVTSLFTSGTAGFAAIPGVDGSRSYIERVTPYPDNIEIEGTQTGRMGGGGPPPEQGGGQGEGTQSVVAHWSIVRLPAHPMMSRRYDERVGYFGISQYDFGTTEQRAARRDYIARWRLEKKDPQAALSEPVHPLIYYVDPATPDVWKPWVRKAILDWQPAFEAAGFKNAIIAMDPPTNDTTWSPDDVRHTVIRWLPSTTENAMGPHVSDPRTGEILNGSIRIYHNVLNLVRRWYVTQVGPLDVRAQQLPLPDSLTGRLLEYVVAHEIGHTLGLRHDQLGSTLYPADSVRSATWVRQMGHTPSIMDYSRYNYVAQPEDHIALEDLIPRIGPYDRFAIMWGYKPVPGATSESERPQLDQWARMQDTVPWYRFSEDNAGGYGTLSEAVGDADPVKSTTAGVKNIRRVLAMLPRVATKPGEDNEDLQELYTTTIGQWQREMLHVATLIGGSTVQYKSGSQSGPVYTLVPKAQQQAALQFLNDNVFTTPMYLGDTAILQRLEPGGALARIGGAQRGILSTLLSSSMMDRLLEAEASAIMSANAPSVYTLSSMLDDIRQGVWSELSTPHVKIDLFRRNLQNVYLNLLIAKINGPPAGSQPNPSTRPPQGLPEGMNAIRGQLMALRAEVNAAVPHAVDDETRTHLSVVLDRIDRTLKP